MSAFSDDDGPDEPIQGATGGLLALIVSALLVALLAWGFASW